MTDYINVEKNRWRLRTWNLICDRLGNIEPENAIVLYLAGERDLDRRIMRRHGFEPENMIAVEKDQSTIRLLRKGRVLAVGDDLVKVLASWRPQRPVHVINADLCSNLCISTQIITVALQNPAFHNCVVSANIQRGREIPGITQGILKLLDLLSGGDKDFAKHRGLGFLLATVINGWSDWTACLEKYPALWLKELKFRLGITEFIDQSYRAGPTTFDSVIFVNRAIDACVRESFIPCRDSRTKIAAVLAHRTMRMNAR